MLLLFAEWFPGYHKALVETVTRNLFVGSPSAAVALCTKCYIHFFASTGVEHANEPVAVRDMSRGRVRTHAFCRRVVVPGPYLQLVDWAVSCRTGGGGGDVRMSMFKGKLVP